MDSACHWATVSASAVFTATCPPELQGQGRPRGESYDPLMAPAASRVCKTALLVFDGKSGALCKGLLKVSESFWRVAGHRTMLQSSRWVGGVAVIVGGGFALCGPCPGQQMGQGWDCLSRLLMASCILMGCYCRSFHFLVSQFNGLIRWKSEVYTFLDKCNSGVLWKYQRWPWAWISSLCQDVTQNQYFSDSVFQRLRKRMYVFPCNIYLVQYRAPAYLSISYVNKTSMHL